MEVPPSLDLDLLRGLPPGGPGATRRSLDGPAGRASDARGESDGVRISLSAEGLARSRAEGQHPLESRRPGLPSSERQRSEPASAELTEEEQREIDDLKQRDREVRAHEAAHKAAAGNLARGGASLSYETGPDGQRYAVGGEVSIDVSPVEGNSAATLRKMERVQAAALAPADPSGQDRQVAAQAAGEARKARAAATRETTGSDEAEGDAATVSCPVCGASGHGPELHGGEVDFRV